MVGRDCIPAAGADDQETTCEEAEQSLEIGLLNSEEQRSEAERVGRDVAVLRTCKLNWNSTGDSA